MSEPRQYVSVGDVVAVTLLDHAQADHLLRFVVYGRVAIVTNESITVDCWHYAGNEERDDNVERFTIATALIDRIETMAVRAVWRREIDA